MAPSSFTDKETSSGLRTAPSLELSQGKSGSGHGAVQLEAVQRAEWGRIPARCLAKPPPARSAADTRQLLESRIRLPCQLFVLWRNSTVNVLVKINHFLPCLWLRLFLTSYPGFACLKDFIGRAGHSPCLPLLPYPNGSLWSGPMKAKYLTHSVTKNSEYLRGSGMGWELLLLSPQTGTLSSDSGPRWAVEGRGKASQTLCHHVLRQMCTMHWTFPGVAGHPLHCGQYLALLSQWGNKICLWKPSQPLRVVLFRHRGRGLAGKLFRIIRNLNYSLLLMRGSHGNVSTVPPSKSSYFCLFSFGKQITRKLR